MNGRKGLFVFGAGVAGTLCLIASAGAGCQNSGSGSGGNGTANGGNTTQGTATNSGPGGNGGNGSMSTSTLSGTAGSTSNSGTGGGSNCTSDMDATINQVAKGADNGGLGTGIKVKVTGAVAMSHKFLVSQSKSTGSCLWGVFLSKPGIDTTAAYSGVLAVSYGTDAVTNDAGSAFCPVPGVTGPAGDMFPDDIAPGDIVDVIGKTDAYAPAQCGTMGNPAANPQVQLANVCSAKKTGTATVPKPAKTGFDLAKIASGDAAEMGKWAGVEVELDNVTSAAPDCTCTTPPTGCGPTAVAGCFGDILLSGSGLTVADKIYYQGLLASQMKTCHKGPNYALGPVTFTSISGFVALDFCTSAVFPDNKCTDIVPQAPAADIDCAAPGGCTN